MSVFSNETLFFSVTQINASTYTVCYEAPPKVVSDGIWGGQKNGRTPMKSFLPMFELQVLIIFVVTQICHLLLKRLGLPLLISQMLAGVILGASLEQEPLHHYMRMLFPYGTHDVISTVSSIGYVLFIFTNGVQMDFSMITRTGIKAWSIALIGLVSPLLIGFSLLYFASDKLLKAIGEPQEMLLILLSHSVVSFAVIYTVLNGLQIQNSELGRLALSSALVSDVLSTTISAISTAVVGIRDMKLVLVNLLLLFAFFVLIPLFCRPAMFWVIKHTPEGRPVKDGYIYLIIIMVFGLGWVSVKINQDFALGAFILGLAVPEGPPLGSALVKKLHFLGTWFFLPIFVTTCVMKADFSIDYPSKVVVTTSLMVLFTHLLQMLAFFLPAIYCQLPLSDALSLALILNSKGVVEIGQYNALFDSKVISRETYGRMLISVMVVASIVQWSVKSLYDPSRKYGGYQKRNLLSLKNNSELRILACVHKKNHISPIIDVIDLCFPTTEHPMTADVLHLIELVGRSLPIFISNRFQRVNSGHHKSYSDDVILAFDIYEHDNLDAVTVNTYTAISPPGLMYEDVCNLALDKVASMIILPFHQRWSNDGAIVSDDKQIRSLNYRVLEIAPCSVGILVSRGPHSIRDTATRLAVIYLGGKDDREALCIARRAVRNQGVNLVVYQLVTKDYKPDLETVLDKVSLQDVIPARAASGNVSYKEIVAKDGSNTAAFLRDIVNEHDFFIVGRRHGLESPQTEGLTEWSEFPELGAIGDLLASPDFGSRASVLVVQQQVSRTQKMGGLRNTS